LKAILGLQPYSTRFVNVCFHTADLRACAIKDEIDHRALTDIATLARRSDPAPASIA
jgi:hypothetical protein